MPGVAAGPFPMNFVRGGGAIESLPPGQICLASKAPIHRLNNIPRIGEDADLTRLRQRLEPDRSRGDFRLLIRRLTQIFCDGAPVTFIAKQCNCGRAARVLPVAETRAVAEDRNLFESGSLFVVVSHS